MGKKRHSAEEVVKKLRQADVELAKGTSIAVARKLLSISEQTYYHWRKEYGGLKVVQAKRFKELEQENARLKRVVGNLALDNAILKEAATGNF
jgi:putative transposase